MHKITEKEFTRDDFSCDHMVSPSLRTLDATIKVLNEYRKWYLAYDSMKDKDKENFAKGINCKKDLWWQIIQLLPSSYNQRRTITLDYEVALNQYFARNHHKLDEWKYYCAWIEKLPYMEDFLVPLKN